MDKYRVWHTEWEEFVTDYPICMNVLTGKIVKFNYGEYSGEEDIEDTKYILSKYTGLKDKNDVEIFEGDVVKTKYGEHGRHIGVVKYGGAKFYSNGVKQYLSWHEDLNGLFEILGNKYEHPHLQKEVMDSDK